MKPFIRRALALALVGGAGIMTGVMALAPAADAATVNANLTGGSLAFVSTPNFPSFATTLNGLDQVVTVNSGTSIDVGDATGSGTGWDVTGTSTTFATSGGTVYNLSTAATTVSAVSDSCDSGATCTTATNTVTYPYGLPAAGTAPTATKFYNATANTGMGNQTITPTWKLAVPANAYAGSYSSTWTVSLVSGP